MVVVQRLERIPGLVERKVPRRFRRRGFKGGVLLERLPEGEWQDRGGGQWMELETGRRYHCGLLQVPAVVTPAFHQSGAVLAIALRGEGYAYIGRVQPENGGHASTWHMQLTLRPGVAIVIPPHHAYALENGRHAGEEPLLVFARVPLGHFNGDWNQVLNPPRYKKH